MIDIHVHIGRWDRTRRDFDEDKLLARMDELHIDRAVLLPMVSPESCFEVIPTREVLAVASRHPDRFIPFCNLDPRNNGNQPDTDFSYAFVKRYKKPTMEPMLVPFKLGAAIMQKTPSEDLALHLLREAHIAVVPGTSFGPGGEGYLRISYANSYDQIQEGMQRMATALKRLPRGQ